MYNWLRIEFWWLIHNIIAHPICGVLNFLSELCFVVAGVLVVFAYPALFLEFTSTWLHDVTMPSDADPRNVDRLKR